MGAAGHQGAALKITALLAIGIALLFALFFLGGPDHLAPRSIQYGWNLGHILFFALLTGLLLRLSPKLIGQSFLFQFFFIISITLFLGLLIEIFQYGLNRMPDIRDLLRNLTGALAVLFFFSPARKTLSRPKVRMMQLLIVLFLAADFYPLATLLLDERRAIRKFPVLADFESRREISRWSGTADFAIVGNPSDPADHLLRIFFDTQPYSGIFLRHFPRDWRGYSHLSWTIYNPSATVLRLTCRIHDLQHTRGRQQYADRFNKTFPILPGKNESSISLEDIAAAPASRRMDTANIRAIGFFVTRLPDRQTVYLDDLRLIR
jgi:VanZ family protein